MIAWKQIQDELRQCRVRRKRALAGNRPFIGGDRAPHRGLVLKDEAEQEHKKKPVSRSSADAVLTFQDSSTDLMRLASLQLVASRRAQSREDQPAHSEKRKAEQPGKSIVHEFKFAESPTTSLPSTPKSPARAAAPAEAEKPKLSRAQRAMLFPFALEIVDEAVRSGKLMFTN